MRQERAGGATHRRSGSHVGGPRSLVSRTWYPSSRAPASPRTWGPRIRCSFFTPQDRRVNRKGCCTRPAAISYMPHSLTRPYSICAKRTFIGRRPTWAGSPVTAMSSTGRSPNGATTLMFEGVPNYPDFSRFWQVVDKHRVIDLLQLADRDSLAHARGRGAGGGEVPQDAAAPRLGRRADQSGGLGVVSPGGGRWSLPDRRYLVADRDRRHPDQPASRRHRLEAGLRDTAVLRGAARYRRQ